MDHDLGQAPDGPAARHEVLRALAARVAAASQPGARRDGLRIALAIEGGGMRGVISAGMALAVAELGLVPAFDAVYGASAGAITGAWLLSRPEGLLGWAEPAYARTLIRRSALLRGRPVADIRALIEDLYQTTFPMDFAAVLANPVELHPLATDAATGRSTDLRPFITNPAELRLALRASAAMPLLAGPPVEFAGRRFYDAGVSESVPYRTALAQGATHVLVLRSRRAPHPVPDGPAPHGPAPDSLAPDSPALAGLAPVSLRPSRSARLLARTTLRRETPALRAAFLARESRLATDEQLLAQYESGRGVDGRLLAGYESASHRPPASPGPSASPASARTPAVFSIRPAPGSPVVSRLATDGALLRAALEAGRAAALDTLGPLLIAPPSAATSSHHQERP
ncbi:MAG: patatin-like phospholipase family protein [Streptosporangiaceae bacterium]